MTTSHSEPPVLDDLLAHAGWLRRLATSLVHDAGRAEDLAQEVFLVALRDQPSGLERPRAWLASVARKLALTQARSGARRTRREQTRRAPGPADPTDDLVAEAELGRAVARVVLDLHEPYRTVLLMRFWRDLPPRRIASELERPIETVKVQLRRGLEHVRARLDEQHGGRKAWALLLAPLATPRSALAAPLVPLGAATLFLAGAAVGVAWLATDWEPGEAAVLEAAVLPAAPRTEQHPRSAPPPGAVEVAVAEAPARIAEPVTPSVPAPEPEPEVVEAVEPPPAVPDWPVQRGCLRDVAGQPIGGVHLEVPMEYRPGWALPMEADEQSPDGETQPRAPRPKWKFATVSDGFGLYELHAPNPGAIVCAEPELQILGWAPSQNPVWKETHDLYAVEAIQLCGRVVGEERRPKPRMAVEFVGTCPQELKQLLPPGVGIQPTPHRVVTDERGEFCAILPRVLVMPRSPDRPRQLFVIEDSNVPIEQTPRFSSGDRRFGRGDKWFSYADQLDLSIHVAEASAKLVFPHAPITSTRQIRGEVVRHGHGPVAGAHVVFAGHRTTTDEHGQFELDVGEVDSRDMLAAYEIGGSPVIDPNIGWKLRRSGGRLDSERLVLPGRNMSIEGTLVDASGAPVAGREYGLADPTYLEPLYGSLEANAAGYANGRLVTDADGRFVLGGLLSQAYRIEVAGRDGESQVFGKFKAGQRNVRLVLEE